MVAPQKMTEPRFWSHHSQKDRFVIFGCGTPKMGKNFWVGTLRATGVKFQSKSEVVWVALCDQSLGMALCTLQSATPAHRIKWFRIEKFDQEREFRFGPLRQWSPCRIFYPFWAPHGRKLRISLFNCRATKTWVQSF